MKNPDRLRVAKAADRLADLVYDFTAGLPREERFGLASQMRRAVVSIGSNIFEGCGRQGSRSMLPFLYHAYGSAGELLFQLRLCLRRDFGDSELGTATLDVLDWTRASLAKLIRYHESKANGATR